MIRFIAALDNKRGIANDHGIPWQGKIPTDVKHFRDSTLHGNVMMGYGWYIEQKLPLPERRNLVASPRDEMMRPGFEQVTDARKFLQEFSEDIWVGGGAALFESTLDLADELHLTLLDADFNCTKFFPEYEENFEKVSESEPVTENGISFRFTVWKRQ
jgi:dihydrofolate reductase